jgi:lipoprotein-releasing system ATP-binding protein
MMDQPLLEGKNLCRILNGDIPVTLIKDANVTVYPKEFLTIIGPSGSGKSSLLYLLGLLDRPTSGTMMLQGHDLSTLNESEIAQIRLEKLGFIFQFHFLLPEFSALENVMLPMQRLGKLTPAESKTRAQDILARLGLADQMHKLPKQMSGGQCQRVAVARALANDPLILLADEPTGNLDTASSLAVQDILHTLAHEDGHAVIAVTHDLAFADRADRRIQIVDGKIVV